MRKNRYIYITLVTILGFHLEAGAQDRIQYAPRLVVSITIDQLRTDYLDAFAPLYGQEGLKKLLKEGLVYENAYYPFSSIDRASAISSVITGVSPYYHGIIGSQWLSKESLRPVSCTDDSKQQGLPSPAQIQVSTLGDELKVATQGQSKVFAIAPQQDAAILSAGHAADGAFWIDSQTGQWTGSKYYSNTTPQWLLANNELRSPSANIKKIFWEPVIELSGTFNYYQHTGDQKPFKHAFKGERKFIEYLASGLVNNDVTETALQCVTNHGIGYDRVTDLLSITYYAGTFDHKPVSECQLELQDTYVRLDREINRLIKSLQTRLGAEHVLFVVTSTGYSDEEDSNYAQFRIPSGSFYMDRTANLLNMYFGAIWGQGRYVETSFRNQIYLNHKLLESKRISLTDAGQRAQEFISQLEGVRNVYTALQLLSSNNPQIEKVRNGFHPEHNGDIIIEVSPGWKILNESSQGSQLTRASYTQFPIIFYGAGIEAGKIKTAVTIDRIAPTIAKAIRIRAPNACSAEPLF